MTCVARPHHNVPTDTHLAVKERCDMAAGLSGAPGQSAGMPAAMAAVRSVLTNNASRASSDIQSNWP